MLFHLIPKLYNPYPNLKVNLIDVVIPHLNIRLKNGTELTAKSPYPNENYLVACKKTESKAANGIYIEIDFIKSFSVETQWSISSDLVISHKVNYHVKDDHYEAITDNHRLFKPVDECLIGVAPVHTQPRMDVLCDHAPHSREKVLIHDEYSVEGMLIKREESHNIPTVKIKNIVDLNSDKHKPDFKNRFTFLTSP